MKSSEISPLLLNCEFPSRAAYLARIEQALQIPSLTHIVTLNAEMVVRAVSDTHFRSAVHHANIVLPDGAGIVWAHQYLGKHPRPALITSMLSFFAHKAQPLPGVDMIHDICAALSQYNGEVYLLGSSQDVRTKAGRVLSEKYNDITVQSLDDDQWNSQLSQQGTPAHPRVLLVAYGAPKQAVWITQHRQELAAKGIRIAIGIGGALEMLTGSLPRAPRTLRQLHLEWLWRLFLEPHRLHRIWNAVVVFPFLVRKNGYPH